MYGPVRQADSGLMLPAAEELRVLATAVSAVCGRPGFVPDVYLDELGDDELGHPGADPWLLAAERCGAGIWERTEGGYRVLDEEAVQVCVDRVRELREQDAWLAGVSERAPAVAAAGTTRFGTGYQKGRLPASDAGSAARSPASCASSVRASSTTSRRPGGNPVPGNGWSWTTFSGRSGMRTRAMSWTQFRRSSSRGTSIRSPYERSLGHYGTSRRSTARNAG